MADIVIKNGLVLTMNPLDNQKLIKSNVIIEDGLIKEISSSNDSANQVIDASGCVVMPGLVNTHTHAAMTLLRGYADDLSLKSWLENNMWPVEAQMSSDDIYTGTLLACAEMIKSGTTSFADMYFEPDSIAKAVEKSGMRASISYGMIELGDTEKGKIELKKGKKFVDEWTGKAGGRINTMYGPHAPNTCSKDFLVKVKNQARKDGKKIHIHVLETEAELNEMKEKYGKCSINMLEDIDFFDKDILAAHCVWLSQGDIEILNEKNVNVSHNPTSNMKLASGTSPVYDMWRKGVNLSIGTDGCASNNNLDMFKEMKLASLLQKVTNNDPTVLKAYDVIKMATSNGASSMDIKSGILKEGFNADLILVDMNKLHLTPIYDPISHLVYSANGSDVKTTIVNGKVLMDNYRLTNLDEKLIMQEASNTSQDLIDRVKSVAQ
ncbi:amidohydrolase family protein [Methanosalsum natronophilum]|nr:amidohydrolase family protein [Methanosalsum natronophilum]MCS3923030.1 5-methylthioadenosine/S-adenosylhomocysteine deaminase [Methanosalsum natronophilum]